MATAQDTRIDQLTERVERLEADVQALRAARQKTTYQPSPSAPDQLDPTAHLWANKAMLREASRRLLAELGIKDRTPIGALELQRRMAQASLDPDEFSRGIMEMRDE